ncbi:hypothetical protein [Pseudonocardia sp. GCM10023141]|uniref:hypothetical protein n=1 Tax=Pseudonocardia sp. GCM10023141 TaxID=3252653 RepID=UPI0036148FC8
MQDTLDAPVTAPDVIPAPPRRNLRWLWAIPAVLIPTALFGLHALAYGRWLVDDSAITFAYARSVAIGAGPSLMPGLPHVEGYSNPAWLGLLVLGRWLGLFDHGAWFGMPDYVAFPKTLALVLVAGAFTGFHAIAAAISRRPAIVTVVAGSIAAAIPSFVIWCVSGLENSLLVFAVVTLAAVLVRANARGALATAWPAIWCGLLAALAALTRPEGLIYAGAFPIALLIFVQRRRWFALIGPAVVSVVAFAVPFGCYLLFRWETFHQLLPTTAVAKSQGLPTVAGFAKVSELVSYAGWLAVLAGAVLVGAAVVRNSPVRDGVLLLLVPLGLALTAFGVLVPDWMEQYRFATPAWALGALVVGVSAIEVLGGLRLRGRVVVGLLTVAAAAISLNLFVVDAKVFRAAPTAPMCMIAQNTGFEFNGYLQILGLRSGTLFAPEIGGAALTGTSLLVDGAGLAEPRIAQYWAAKDWAGVRDYTLDEIKPTFIKAHGSFRPQMAFETDPRFVAAYTYIGPTPNEGGNWVRTDLVHDEATLAKLREWAQQSLAADAVLRAAPRSSCGDRLVPGATSSS